MVALRIRLAFAPGTRSFVLQAFGTSYFTRGSVVNLSSSTRTPIAYALVAARGHYAFAGPSIGLSYVQPGTAPSAPQQLWPAQVTSLSARMVVWPPADGTNPPAFNFYRTDMPLGPGVPLNANPRVPSIFQNTGIPYAALTDNTVQPGTSYTYYATATSSATAPYTESSPSPNLSIVTQTTAGFTRPAKPTAPETFIPAYAIPTLVTTATKTVWTATQNSAAANTGAAGAGTDNGVAGNHKLSVNCSLSYALANAIAGDVISVSILKFTSSVGSYAFTVPATASGIYIVSAQDPGLGTGGALPAYSYEAAYRKYTKLAATATIPAGATSLTLTGMFPYRTGWYHTRFDSTNPPQVESTVCLYTQNSYAVVWNVGLQANCGTRLMVGVGNQVTPWDAGIPIGSGAVTNPSPTMPIIEFSASNSGLGLLVQASNVRFVGICIQPAANHVTGTAYVAAISLSGGATNVMFDRCVSGRDNTVSTRSFFSRCFSLSGSNVVLHQGYFFGVDGGPGGGDSQPVFFSSGGPMVVQNCYLEGVSEIFISGGSFVPQNALQHDITVRYNFTHKQTTWQQLTTPSPGDPQPNPTISFRLKNHFEMKCGIRFEYFGNLAQNNAQLQGSQSQGGRAIVLTPRDQISASASQALSSLTADGAGTATAVCAPHPFVSGQHFATTITGATNTAFNGTWERCTAQSGTQFIFPVPVGLAGGSGGAPHFSRPPIVGGMWQNITDFYAHDNQIYDVAQMSNPSTNIDYNPALYSARVLFENNVCLLNPAMTDNFVPTPNKTQLIAFDISPPLTDFELNHNTVIACAAGTGYAAVNISDSFRDLQGGTSNTLNDRTIFTNNIIDCTQCIIVSPGGTLPPHNNATGGVMMQFSFNNANMVLDKNIFTIDPSSGANAFNIAIAGTTYNPIAYSALGTSVLINHNAIPDSPSDWNIISGTYATASTTGGPIGAIFQTVKFPQVGAVLVAPEDYSTVANIGKPQALVLENFPGFSFGGKNITQQVAAIKALNPTGKVFTYVDIMEIDSVNSGVGTTYHAAWVAISAYNWFLRTAFPAGSIVQSQAAQNSVNINQSRLSASNDPVRPNATYRQWYATFAASYFPQNADGIFTDNFQLWPKEDGDYAESGSSQSRFNATTTQNWRNAYADWVTQAKAVAGGPGLVIGNIGDWGQGGGNTPVTPLTGYPGILDGGAYEGAMGAGFSLENTSWVSMMNNYAVIMQNMKSVNYMFFMHDHSPVTGYAAMRYGLCSCLLDNGYYYFNLGGSLNSVSWFDEFDFNLGTPIAGPNNPANGTYSSGGLTVWSQGVWRRDFQNGIILVNPRGNTAKNVTLEVDVWRLRGTQDPVTNSAAKITAGNTILMADPNVAGTGGSGLVLSRTPT